MPTAIRSQPCDTVATKTGDRGVPEVGSVERHRPVVGRAIGDQRKTTVVLSVELFVICDRRSPRRGALDTIGEMAVFRTGRRPGSESVVDTPPGIELVGDRDQLAVRIKRTGVRIAGLSPRKRSARHCRACGSPAHRAYVAARCTRWRMCRTPSAATITTIGIAIPVTISGLTATPTALTALAA